MNVIIRNVDSKEKEQVIIECIEVTEEVERIRLFAESSGQTLSGSIDGRLYSVNIGDIYYFEAVDERIFAYSESKVFEVKGRLYEIERKLSESSFLRCSKSTVINLMKIESVSPALNGRFTAHMKNGERVIISRQYVPALKKAVLK
ncbi:MAG: LytTR family DNA-binding domain-containing protein [Huintestinicola sp.]|uniref:LytTR family DNA-binding domain-containing protein n=1 Tax=Huintestinicola sp. TaxID=2981661 RepID=UPI003F0A2055